MNRSFVKVSGCDIDGIARGKIMHMDKFESSVKNGFGFCSVIFGWDMHDKSYESEVKVSNAANGYADILAKIDLGSKRELNSENGNLAYYLLDFYDPTSGLPLAMCPRSLLKRMLCLMNEKQMTALCGIEFEFYNFKETPDSLHQKHGVHLTPLTPGNFCYSLLRPTLNQEYFQDILKECKQLNIDIEALHTETGPGVYEAALKYTDALTLADNAHIFKTTVKELGLKHGIMSCFMAKPHMNLPGCSGHIHVSLAHLITKESLFKSDINNEEKKGIEILTLVMRQFLAGVLKGLPYIMPMLAPTINSYKRLCGQFWAPSNVTYGFENRTSAIRVIAPPSCPPSATRLEIRVAGADVNPYLALAGILGCGWYGIYHALELPYGPLEGDATSHLKIGIPEELPRSLREATMKMASPTSLARDIFGKDFVEHFATSRLHECNLFDQAVTNWELVRYMETV